MDMIDLVLRWIVVIGLLHQ